MSWLLLGVFGGAIIWIPVGGLVGYWLAAAVIAADAFGEEQ